MYQHRHSLLLAFAILGVALNLRPVLASISPLLDTIETATGMSHTTSSLLTTLPIFAMGVIAYFSNPLRRTLGEHLGISLGLFLITLACLARFPLTSTSGLLLSALIAGIGIAIVQALAPSLIKRTFSSHSDRIMGFYTTGIMGGAAITAATVAPLNHLLGWSTSLAIWAVPALIALVMWLIVTTKRTHPTHKSSKVSRHKTTVSLWQQRRVWELVVFFGIGTGAYTLVLAWLPPYFTSLGLPASQAGFILSAVTVVEVAAGLIISTFIYRFNDRRYLLLAVLTCLVLGLLGLIFAPLRFMYGTIVFIGIGIGALFPLSMILTLSHCNEPSRAGDLVAFVQGGGYIIASFTPLFAGIIRDLFSDLSHAWTLMLVGTFFLMGLCWRFSPRSYQDGNI